MNLVVDDAVEVRLATKTEEEKRRPLGMDGSQREIHGVQIITNSMRIQAKSCSRGTTSPSSKPFESRIHARHLASISFPYTFVDFYLRPAVQVPPITHHDGIDRPVMFHNGNILGEQLLLERQGH